MCAQGEKNIKQAKVLEHFRLEKDLIEAIKKQAQREHRDKTGMITHMLKTYLENIQHRKS